MSNMAWDIHMVNWSGQDGGQVLRDAVQSVVHRPDPVLHLREVVQADELASDSRTTQK